MLKGYRDGKFAIGLVLGVVIATLCFLWIFSVNYCPDAPCNYQKPPDQTETYYQRWFPVPWYPNATLQPKPPTTKSAPSDHEYYDLQAQENMARATNFIAWASFLTVLTSVLGVWLLVTNLSVTRDSSRDESRAYVHLKSISFTPRYENGDYWIDCAFSVENTGATPCKRFETFAGAKYEVAGVRVESLPEFEADPTGWNTLPSTDVFTTRVAALRLQGWEDTSEFTIHVGGAVRYVTFFGEVFETEFSFADKIVLWEEILKGEKSEVRIMSRTTFNTRSYEQIS